MLLGLATIGPVSFDALSITLKELWLAILLFIGGGVLALGLGQRLPPVAVGDVTLASVVRRTTVAAGEMFEQADGVLRRWPVAGLSLLVLVIAFIAAMV
jgi:hypothetical protein